METCGLCGRGVRVNLDGSVRQHRCVGLDMRVVKLSCGGFVILQMKLNIGRLTKDERVFVSAIADALHAYESAPSALLPSSEEG